MRTITILFAIWALLYGCNTANVCTKKRCDFLKALLPFFIILHHHAQRTDWPWPFDGDFEALGAPVVMIFFFISGYGLEYKRSSKGLRLQDLPARLKKLFTPTLLPILMFIGMLRLTDVNVLDCLKSYLTDNWYPLPYSWFVVILAILYVGFYLCARWRIPEASAKSFLVCLFAFSLSTEVALMLIHAPSWMIVSDMAVFVGAFYKQYENKILKILEWKGARSLIAILPVLFVLAYLPYFSKMHIIICQSKYLWLVLMFLMFAYVKIFKSKVIDFLSKISSREFDEF